MLIIGFCVSAKRCYSVVKYVPKMRQLQSEIEL